MHVCMMAFLFQCFYIIYFSNYICKLEIYIYNHIQYNFALKNDTSILVLSVFVCVLKLIYECCDKRCQTINHQQYPLITLMLFSLGKIQVCNLKFKLLITCNQKSKFRHIFLNTCKLFYKVLIPNSIQTTEKLHTYTIIVQIVRR